MKCYAVIDTNVVVSALLSVLKDNDLAESVPLREQDTYLITGNKKHFPLKEFVVSPSEFLEIVEKNK